MNIGLMCATGEEFQALHSMLTDVSGNPLWAPTHPEAKWNRNEFAGLHFYKPAFFGKDDKHQVTLVQTGMGKVNAAMAATLLCHQFSVEALVFAGVAGGLDPYLPVGSVILGSSFVQHDYGMIRDQRMVTAHIGTLPTGEPADLDDLYFTVPAAVDEILLTMHDPSKNRYRGPILTGDTFINCSVTREFLYNSMPALAVDMESAAVAQVAAAYKKDAYIFRTLSDLADDDSHNNYAEFAEREAQNAAAVVTDLLKLL